MTTLTYDTPTAKMDDQQKAFYEALRNPLERACKVVSDAFHAAVAAIDSVIPDFGWKPSDA